MCRSQLLPVFLASASCVSAVMAQQPAPVMEFSSVLTGLDVIHHDGRLELEDANGALTTTFLPGGAKVDVVITKAGSDQPLHTQPFMVGPPAGAFNRVEQRSLHREFKFTEPGDYVATYRVDGKPVTVVPFTVEFEKNDDVFDPNTHVYTQGPWSQWAYLFASVRAGAEANPQIRMWVRKKSFQVAPEADVYTVELRKDGDLLAEASKGFTTSKEWQRLQFELRHPESKGGRAITVKELLSQNGTINVFVRRNEQPYAAFQFEVLDGKPALHPQQASAFQPRTQYIVPRFAGLTGTLGQDSQGHTVWMKRLSESAATSAFAGKSATVAGPTEEDRSRWNWVPRSIDPRRPFNVTITDVETRSDTAMHPGEDLVVFGTGFPTGVRYMKVGDTKAREIPGGKTYSSKVFRVCGHKIVLVKKNQVAVYDTQTERLTTIPETDIFLYDVSPNLIHSNGYLIATVNKATAVTDRTIIKVIDVSQDPPVIIPIKNSDYVDRDVSSVAVDAKHGNVAVSSRARKVIAAAKVAPLASQHVFGVTDYRGVGSFQIFLEGDWVTYADEDWRVRLLDLNKGTPTAITEQPFPRAGNGFYVRKGRLAVATTEEKTGSRYRFAVSDLKENPQLLSGTGTPIPGTSGALGMAGSAAIAIDKTVFLAGPPFDSIGVGQHLQLLDSDSGTWQPLRNAEGKVISASDVQTSVGLLTFKALNDAGRTVVGYATYGERIQFQKSATVVASSVTSKKRMEQKPSTANTRKKLVTEIDEAFLADMLSAEDELLAAFTQAFGAKVARQKIVEGFVATLKNAGRDHLIDIMKSRSKAAKALAAE